MLIASEPSSGGENVTIGRIRKKSSPTLHLDFDLHSSAGDLRLFDFQIFLFSTPSCTLFIVSGIINTKTQHVVHAQRRPTAEPQRAWPGSGSREMGSPGETQGQSLRRSAWNIYQ